MNGALSRTSVLRCAFVLLACLGVVQLSAAQSEGRAVLAKFVAWKSTPENSTLTFNQALDKYRDKLKLDGVPDAVADRTIRLIAAHDEGEWYESHLRRSP